MKNKTKIWMVQFWKLPAGGSRQWEHTGKGWGFCFTPVLLLFSSLRTEWHFPPSKSQRCRFLAQVNGLAMPGVLLHINECFPVFYSSDLAGQRGSLGRGTLGRKGQCCRSPSCSGQYFWEAREVRQERGKEHRTGVGAPVQPPPLKKHCKFSKKNRKSSTFLPPSFVLWKTSNLQKEYRKSI